MIQSGQSDRFKKVGDGSGQARDDRFYREELQLAFRNRGMPLEALRYPLTPTGMHYLLTHFDIPEVAADEWRLRVGGMISKPLSLSLEEIKARLAITRAVTMECAGNGRALLTPRSISQPWLVGAIGTAEWTGTPLRGLLEEAGIDDGAAEILFTGLDRGIQGEQIQYYQRSLSLEQANKEEVLLVYDMNGAPLQPQHGYPLRLIVPGWYGMASVKWLSQIETIGDSFEGYQMGSYRYSQSADDPGEPVNEIRVRSLMIPPGIPDFLTRTRLIEAGRVTLKGRAWAGRVQVTRVEVSIDGGQTWSDGELGEHVGSFAWRAWSFEWRAKPGKQVLCVRATDADGNVQPNDQPWNYRGMGNNMIQRVDVLVE